jgi:hypothetical protein
MSRPVQPRVAGVRPDREPPGVRLQHLNPDGVDLGRMRLIVAEDREHRAGLGVKEVVSPERERDGLVVVLARVVVKPVDPE